MQLSALAHDLAITGRYGFTHRYPDAHGIPAVEHMGLSRIKRRTEVIWWTAAQLPLTSVKMVNLMDSSSYRFLRRGSRHKHAGSPYYAQA